MKVTPDATLPDVMIVDSDVFGDERGFFLESYHAERYVAGGVAERFVQDNVSRSRQGILRGLHLQHPRGQGKLVGVLVGEVFDVAVDVRVGSPTFGRWAGFWLKAPTGGAPFRQVYIPPGFAHGFCVTSEDAIFSYKCTDLYNPASELGVAWNDPDLAIEWPIAEPLLSAKDQRFSRLAEIPSSTLPVYGRQTP